MCMSVRARVFGLPGTAASNLRRIVGFIRSKIVFDEIRVHSRDSANENNEKLVPGQWATTTATQNGLCR